MGKCKITVDDFKLRVFVRALYELRNQLIAESKTTEDIDILLLRLIG